MISVTVLSKNQLSYVNAENRTARILREKTIDIKIDTPPMMINKIIPLEKSYSIVA